MEYIASLSYGKDSIAMLEIIKQNDMPLDRIIHVEVWATPEIPADLPPMVEFKDYADKVIKERYGIKVERVSANKSYEEWFYSIFSRGKRKGELYGFPMQKGAWCNGYLKRDILNKLSGKNIIQYLGIAADEPNRYHNLTDRKISPLVEYNVTELHAREICESIGLLSPIYTQSKRGGCWFCHNQTLNQLRLLRKQYPEYWQLMLKWDNDSPITFHSNGKTVQDLDRRFAVEDLQGVLL